MNKLIIFDLDGVLIDSKEIHFNALNKALKSVSQEYVISPDEQKNTYEGIPTKEKLNLLTEKKGLSKKLHKKIWEDKQLYTTQMLSSILVDTELINFFKLIESKNIHIAVASNSIFDTVESCLISLGLLPFVGFVISNEGVKNPKPHPEMYWKAMSYFNTTPDNTIIFEDSIIGKMAVQESKASLIEIENRRGLTIDKINEAIDTLSKNPSLVNPNLNILIPMAGAGSRFTNAGYVFPKPLIDVDGKPMIHAVVDSLNIESNYIYIAQKDHVDKYNLLWMMNLITPGCNLVSVEGLTEGAAITCLSAKSLIDNDNPLIIANSDQIVDWDSRDFLYELYKRNADGGIATFKSSHPKWSYARADSDGLVLEVAEKKPISDNATVGIYYWKHGSDFVKYAERMINKNIRVNEEFYTCPVFNEAIEDGKRIYIVPVNKMWGVGTPEDLDNYLRSRND